MSKKSLARTRHAHGCARCRTRYEDACAEPAVDQLCDACRGLRVWQLLIDNRAPRDCCRERCHIATREERDRYRLGGTRLWFICSDCARTHPFDPRRTS